MKKVFSLFLICLLCVSIAAASPMTDLFNYLTGLDVEEGVVDNTAAPEPVQASEPIKEPEPMHDTPPPTVSQPGDNNNINDKPMDNMYNQPMQDGNINDKPMDNMYNQPKQDGNMNDKPMDNMYNQPMQDGNMNNKPFMPGPNDNNMPFEPKDGEPMHKEPFDGPGKFIPNDNYQPDPYNPPQDFKPMPYEPNNDFKPMPNQPQQQPNMPEGCHGKQDEYGNFRMVCDKQEKIQPVCPPDTDIVKETKRCADGGGQPKTLRDNRGCKFVECQYGRGEQQSQPGNYFEQKDIKCPTADEMNQIKKSCESMNGRTVMNNNNGCNYVDCVKQNSNDQNSFRRCAEDDDSFREQIKQSCIRNGGNPVKSFDPQGCPITLCERPQTMQIDSAKCGPVPQDPATENCETKGGRLIIKYNTEGCTEFIKCEGIDGQNNYCDNQGPPKEAYDKCELDGGNLVVKFDENKCMNYVNCVRRGDENSIEYENVNENIDIGTLMDIALKLEGLNKEFDQLSKKTDDLSKYYESEGNAANAEKFNRVTGMLDGAKGKVTDLMLNIRSKIGRITTEDLIGIKHDIKYIKEVVLNDILYVMFTPAEEIGSMEMPEFESEFKPENEKPISGSQMSDQDPGYLFDQNMRICQPYEFHPPEDSGATLYIKGLEGKDCIIYAESQTPLGKMDMTCKYPNYAFGMRGPEDLMKYCEGTMKEMFEMHGGPGGRQQPMGEMMGCEKVDRGFEGYERGKCGNGCCEPGFGESYDNCPRDCMSSQQQIGVGGQGLGVEFGRIGCNNPNDKENARADCDRQNQVACEVRDIPDSSCAAWVVCEKDESRCNEFLAWCSKNPGACPGSPGYNDKGPQMNTIRTGLNTIRYEPNTLKYDPATTNSNEKCMMDCVGPDVICRPGPNGEENPACQACAEKCVNQVGSGNNCLTDETLKLRERECMSKGEHMEAKPMEGDSGEGYTCIIGVACIDRSDEWGDEPRQESEVNNEQIEQTQQVNQQEPASTEVSGGGSTSETSTVSGGGSGDVSSSEPTNTESNQGGEAQ